MSTGKGILRAMKIYIGVLLIFIASILILMAVNFKIEEHTNNNCPDFLNCTIP